MNKDQSSGQAQRPRFTPEKIRSLAPDEVFVFGSHVEGTHCGGAGHYARLYFGAKIWQGVGLQGQSYAIPVFDLRIEKIRVYVDEFIEFAKAHPEKVFYVIRIGCGGAGFKDKDIAPLFKDAMDLPNVILPEPFVNVITDYIERGVFDRQSRLPRFTPEAIDSLAPDEVFVFGSNLEGAHGGGAARVARKYFGAIWGQGVGLQGQSYAIPTMQGGVETIRPYVDEFIAFTKTHRKLFFYVTRIGCGIAGFKDEDIAPLFKKAVGLPNVILPKEFVDILETTK
jgi:hypothetical protein